MAPPSSPSRPIIRNRASCRVRRIAFAALRNTSGRFCDCSVPTKATIGVPAPAFIKRNTASREARRDGRRSSNGFGTTRLRAFRSSGISALTYSEMATILCAARNVKAREPRLAPPGAGMGNAGEACKPGGRHPACDHSPIIRVDETGPLPAQERRQPRRSACQRCERAGAARSARQERQIGPDRLYPALREPAHQGAFTVNDRHGHESDAGSSRIRSDADTWLPPLIADKRERHADGHASAPASARFGWRSLSRLLSQSSIPMR